MSYTDERLSAYLNDLVPERPAELKEMEAYAEAHGFPIIGPAAGHYCYLIARLMDARRIFELGSGYGYSTAWFARAVQENGGGEVYHTVWDKDLSARARQHLNALGYGSLIHYRVSESVEALQEADGTFDLIFNDITKNAYPAALDVVEERLRQGGVLIADNALMGGRVLDEENREASIEAIREFTRRLTTGNGGWIASLVPIRDGLMVAYRK